MGKLPNKVTIAGHDFKIIRGPLRWDEENNYCQEGECDTRNYVITINTRTKQDRVWSVLLHEMIHAALDLSGVSETYPKRVDEAIVTAIENGLYPAIRKKLFK